MELRQRRLTQARIAAALGVSRSTVYRVRVARWIHLPKLPWENRCLDAGTGAGRAHRSQGIGPHRLAGIGANLALPLLQSAAFGLELQLQGAGDDDPLSREVFRKSLTHRGVSNAASSSPCRSRPWGRPWDLWRSTVRPTRCDTIVAQLPPLFLVTYHGLPADPAPESRMGTGPASAMNEGGLNRHAAPGDAVSGA